MIQCSTLRLPFDCPSTALRLPFDEAQDRLLRVTAGCQGEPFGEVYIERSRNTQDRLKSNPFGRKKFVRYYRALRLPFDEVHIERCRNTQGRLLRVT